MSSDVRPNLNWSALVSVPSTAGGTVAFSDVRVKEIAPQVLAKSGPKPSLTANHGVLAFEKLLDMGMAKGALC